MKVLVPVKKNNALNGNYLSDFVRGPYLALV